MKTKDLIDIKAIGWRLVWGTALLTATPAVTGCNTSPAGQDRDLTAINGEQFDDSTQPRHMNRILEAQAASGARDSATLYTAHFDGGNPTVLNSLGEQKLKLMLEDDDALPLVVYLDIVPEKPAPRVAEASASDTLTAVPGDAVTDGRVDSVKVFLRDHGVKDDQVKVVVGANPATWSASAPRIKSATAADAKEMSIGDGKGTTK